MKKSRVSNTAQANLLMLADLGIEEAVRFQNVLKFSPGIFDIFRSIPMASRLPQCVAMIAEILYERTNSLIAETDNPLIIDLACGYSPRVLRVCDESHSYIGVDLPDVARHLSDCRNQLIPENDAKYTNYYSVDLTDHEAFSAFVRSMNTPATVITQALLTYLTLEQKQILTEQIRKLLLYNGGCWIIPDAEPDRLLPEIFQAVMGSGAYSVYEQVMHILDHIIKRDRKANGWSSLSEITTALETAGFRIRKVPLYTDDLHLRALHPLSEEAQKQLIAQWKNTSALIAEV